jgi:hypothetical protein
MIKKKACNSKHTSHDGLIILGKSCDDGGGPVVIPDEGTGANEWEIPVKDVIK